MSNFEALSTALNDAARAEIAAGSDPEDLANALLTEGVALLVAAHGRDAAAELLTDLAARIVVEASSNGD